MRNVVDMLTERLSDLTEECFKEVLEKFPVLSEKREAVVDWTTNMPWGATAHQITVANTPIARFEVGCRPTENLLMFSFYRKGPLFFVVPEEVEKLLQEV